MHLTFSFMYSYGTSLGQAAAVLYLSFDVEKLAASAQCNITSIIENLTRIQWNPSLTDTFGEHSFGRYTEVAIVEGLFCVQTFHLGPVYLAVISQLAVLRGGRSTVYCNRSFIAGIVKRCLRFQVMHRDRAFDDVH